MLKIINIIDKPVMINFNKILSPGDEAEFKDIELTEDIMRKINSYEAVNFIKVYEKEEPEEYELEELYEEPIHEHTHEHISEEPHEEMSKEHTLEESPDDISAEDSKPTNKKKKSDK